MGNLTHFEQLNSESLDLFHEAGRCIERAGYAINDSERLEWLDRAMIATQKRVMKETIIKAHLRANRGIDA